MLFGFFQSFHDLIKGILLIMGRVLNCEFAYDRL